MKTGLNTIYTEDNWNKFINSSSLNNETDQQNLKTHYENYKRNTEITTLQNEFNIWKQVLKIINTFASTVESLSNNNKKYPFLEDIELIVNGVINYILTITKDFTYLNNEYILGNSDQQDIVNIYNIEEKAIDSVKKKALQKIEKSLNTKNDIVLGSPFLHCNIKDKIGIYYTSQSLTVNNFKILEDNIISKKL